MQDTMLNEFADRAKAILGGRGYQRRLAAALGVHTTTVSRWVSGDLDPPAYAWAVVELLEALDAASRQIQDLTPDRWHQ